MCHQRARFLRNMRGLRGILRDVVEGPGAAFGLAVICPPDDFQTLVRHALIRYSYRQDRA